MSQANTTQYLRLLACSTALAGLFATGAMAQSAPEAGPIEEVVVTGTHIRGAAPVGNNVQSIGAAKLAESGKATIGDFLRDLPINFAGNVATSDNVQGGQEASPAAANLTGGQGVNLRGLGALSTLVLVNGRRVQLSGQYGDFVDVTNIPVSAISRIEILQDGASAVYGSDAVGGVVNFIMKRGGDGATTSLRVGTTTEGGGREVQATQSFGTSWDGGQFFVDYEYNLRDRVWASDRSSLYNGGDLSPDGGVNWRRFAGRASTAANIFAGTPVANGTVAYSVPGGAGTGLTVANLIPAKDGVGNTYDLWENFDVLPRMERHSFYASFDQDLGRKAHLYGDFRYTRRQGNYRLGYATLYGTLPSTSPYYIPGTTNNFGVRIGDRGLHRDVSVDSFGGELGVRYDLFGDWKVDVNGSFGLENQSSYAMLLRDTNIYDKVLNGSTTASAPSSVTCALSGINAANVGALPGGGTAAQRFCAGLNYTPFNPYSTLTTPDSVLNELIGYTSLNYQSWIAQGSVTTDGTLVTLPGGPVKVAAGLDARRERIDGTLDYNSRSILDTHVPYGATARSVFSAFAEAVVPIVGKENRLPFVQALDFSAAVRHERSSGLGSFRTTNPKLGLSWKPVDDVKIRASWGTSFHAPPMRYAYNGPQPVPGGNAAFLNASTYLAPCNTTMVRLNGIVGTPGGTGNCTLTAIAVSGGAGPGLKPETSSTWTVGMDLTPRFVPGLELGFSYFNIKIDDRIARINGGSVPSILSQYFATGSSPYAQNINLNPTLAQVNALMVDPRYLGQTGTGPVQSAADVAAIINATQANLASLKMSGMDLSANYTLDTHRIGSFDVFFNGTVIFNYDVQSTPGQPFVDQLNQFASVGNPVSFRSKQGIGWTSGPWRAIASVNYVGGYACKSGCYVPNPVTGAPQLNTVPVKIKPWTTVDLQVNYDLSGLGNWGRDALLSLSVLNVGNARPPFIDAGNSLTDALPDPYDAANASVIGRTVALTLTKRW
jgi:iron complex outermembrane recepter protein